MSRPSLWFIIVEEERRDGSTARHLATSTARYGRDAVAEVLKASIGQDTASIRSVTWESCHEVADALITAAVKDYDPIRMDRINDLLQHAQELVQLVEGPGCAAWTQDGERLKDQQEWANFYCSVKGLEALEKAL